MNFVKESTMLLPFMLYITFAAANEAKIKCETCIKVEDLCYNVSHVLDFQAPFRKTIVITKIGILGNTLYYAFEPNISDPEYYKVGYVNLDETKEHGVLVGPTSTSNFMTFDFDENTRKMYLGGGDGIYVAQDGKNPEHFSSRGDTIQSIFFKKNLYFVRYGENVIVEKSGELFIPHEEYGNVKNFVIGRSNHLIYLSNTGLYVNKMGTNDTIILSKNPFFRGLTINNGDEVYAWWIDGIYKVIIDEIFKESRIVKIADIPNIGAVTFDKDNNYLFSSEKGLYQLSLFNDTKC